MGLIAHYKLDDLTASVGPDLTYLHNSGKLVSTDGKLGAAYQRMGLNDGTDYLGTTEDIHLSSSFTMACWAYVTSAQSSANGLVTNHSHEANTGAGITVKYMSSTDFRISCNTGTGTSRTYHSYYGTSNIKDRWAHLLLRFDASTNNLSLWVDGVKEFSMTYAMKCVPDKLQLFKWSTSHGGAAYLPGAILDDVRIYDHALSEKEIKELAKAKVLHYKFDPADEPTTNVWSGNLSIYNNFGVPATLIDTGQTYMGAKILRLGMTVDSANSARLADFRSSLYSHGVYGGRMTFLANTKYAASIRWKPVNKSDVVVGGTASNIGGWTSKGSQYEGDGWNRYTAVRTGAVTTNKTDSIFFSFYCPSMQLNETVFIDFCAPQVEVGKDYSTPYVSGTRQGTIRDCSGFRNDGLSPSFAVKPESPLGFSYGEFNDLGQSTGTFSLTSETMTGSVWLKKTGDSTNWRTIFASNGNVHPLIISPSNQVSIFDGGQRSFSYALSDADWHHFVVIWKNGSADLYVDGAFNSTVATSYNVRTQPLRRIGNWDSGTYPVGSIADIRIYATALSPEDILELYQTRTSIDNVGNLHTYEFDEVSGGTPGVNSQGIAKFSSITEVGRPVRYVRDWLNGSTANAGNHWVEVQAIDPSGTNVAAGKSSTTLTDGNTASSPYYSGGSGNASVTVDLGSVHNITYLHIWHYWADGRTYHKTKTEVSTDGANWITVFDSAKEGEYAETPEGKKVLLYPDKASIDSFGNIYTKEILEA